MTLGDAQRRQFVRRSTRQPALKRLCDAGSAYLWALTIERLAYLALAIVLLAVLASRLASILAELRSLQ